MEYEDIRSEVLAMLPDSLDKHEGSVAYILSVPIAYESAKIMWVLSQVMNLLMPDTAGDEWLDTVVRNYGVSRRSATKSLRRLKVYGKDATPLSVPIGSRFRKDDLSVVVTLEEEVGVYQAEAEQEGVIGNQYMGEVLPISNIAGISSAELSDVLIEATDAESDEALRERFYEHVQSTAFAGNAPAYEETTLGIGGVGAVKVYPVWNGPGTVLLLVGNERGRAATPELVKIVQDYYQPTDAPETGLAPIGHTVTVATATEVPLTISASISVAEGVSFATVQNQISEAMQEYITSINFSSAIVYISRLTVAALNVVGVLDVQNVAINGLEQNLELAKTAELYEVPGGTTFSLTEVSAA